MFYNQQFTSILTLWLYMLSGTVFLQKWLFSFALILHFIFKEVFSGKHIYIFAFNIIIYYAVYFQWTNCFLIIRIIHIHVYSFIYLQYFYVAYFTNDALWVKLSINQYFWIDSCSWYYFFVVQNIEMWI